MGQFYLCVHGHFYQPPRENPWLEAIEPQKSAAPFADWNERIHAECYQPNARARVLDNKGEIVGIVNNYENINFNIGPTLFSWLEEFHPDTYHAILEADRLSLKVFGRGNAIAQVYNHMIMPLATRRDQQTQVSWGIEDFKTRFKRNPEAIWLAETACSAETLEILMEFDMRYVILEPHQAESIRPFNGENWEDVSQGQIDPKRPYRFFSRETPGKFIDIFFYDGPLSRAMSFGDLLADAKNWLNHIDGARGGEPENDPLLHMATDGETYGHHKHFADRVLAYATLVEAPKRGYAVTNYAAYLDAHPPQFEVRLKAGEDKKGTAWSCAHGLRRWYDDCGCRTGGDPEWTQHWRKPLREALDWLREELSALYEKNIAAYVRRPWEARNDYIHIILDRSPSPAQKFFLKHEKHSLSPEEKVICLKWLEIQRHAMLMYTSCGWFFSELSGVETVQILEYAARAIQLAEELTGISFKPEFMKRLAKAKSNIAAFKDASWIYENWIQPKQTTLEKMAGFFAISAMFDSYLEGRQIRFYSSDISVLHQRLESFGDIKVHFGHLKITSRMTREEKDLMFMAVHVGLYDFRCSVKPFESQARLEAVEKQFFEDIHAFHIVELFREMDEIFGENYLALKDLPLKERTRILGILTQEVVEQVSHTLEKICDENRQVNDIYRSVNLPTPDEIQYAAEHTLKRRIHAALRQFAKEGFNSRKTAALYKLIDTAHAFQANLADEEIRLFLSRELERRTRALVKELKSDTLQECLAIEKISKKLKIDLDKTRPQEQIFFLTQSWIREKNAPASIAEGPAPFFHLLNYLKISADPLKRFLHEKTAHANS